MSDAKILVDLGKNRYRIKMVGRPTFAVAGVLRKLAKRLDMEKSVNSLTIAMGNCDGMDSTIMGMLATLALKVRSRGGEPEVLNAGRNRELLNGLGLGKVFRYVDDPASEDGEWTEYQTGLAPPVPSRENAETIIDAHKTLMEADEGNVEKFKNVVEMLEKELDE